MSNEAPHDVEICTVCGHLPQACLGHHIDPTLLGHARRAGPGSGDGYIGPIRRVALGSEAHRDAVTAPLKASERWG